MPGANGAANGFGAPGAGNSGGGGGGVAGVELFNGASGTIIFPLQVDTFFADQLIVPNASWAVPAVAPTDQDNTSPVRSIVSLIATPETGRGVSMFVPGGATSVRIWRVYKAATAPGAARTAGSKLYWTTAKDATAIPAFQSSVLDDMDFAATTNPVVDSVDKTLDGLPGVTGLVEVYFEITRIAPTAGTDLVGAVNLSCLRFEWYKPGSPP
jgi:hypothetical protein